MAARSPSRLAVSRHVYLRTQQRRLRHVKSIILRNLSFSDNSFYLDSPLALATHFTIHPSHSLHTVLYESDPVLESYNPSWEAIHFTSPDYCKYAALSGFTLKVWMSYICSGKADLTTSRVVLEKTITLSDLAYLGTMVSKDGSSYPPNTLVVGMFEGYYTHPTVYGVIAPPRVTHSLTDLLPPMSLLEVNKAEVQDSYHHPTLKRILNRQEVLNITTSVVRQRREAMNRYKMKEQIYFEHSRERERLARQVKMLQQQLQEQQLMEEAERKVLHDLRQQLNSKEESLELRLKDLREQKEQYDTDYQKHCTRMDRLARFERFCNLRQRSMVHELGQTFVIRQMQNAFTICNIVLPNADQHDQPSIQDQLGVALGYVAQLIHHLASTLSVPLQYPLHLNGSKSSIYDYISDISAVQNNRDFPLFPRGSEKEVFMYAVYLLNKDICQLRQHSGIGVSKSHFKHTLPNLKSLIDRLTVPMVSRNEAEVKFPLQAISVPTPSFMSNHTSQRETTSPSQNLMEETYSTIAPDSLPTVRDPSDSHPAFQENDFPHQQPRDSVSSEPSAEPAARVQSPPLQFELHDAFLQQPRTSYPSSAACPIQMKPTSLFTRLSPIYSEGSPAISEADRDWMTQSHTHAGLHKVGAQVENEISSAGVHLCIQEEEEELAAVGGGLTTEMILLGELGSGELGSGKLSSNAESPQEYKQSTTLADSIVLTFPPRGETELMDTTQCQVSDMKEPSEQERHHCISDSDQGYPPSDDTCTDSIVNPFKEEEQGLPLGNHTLPMSSMKSGLATPHMLRSAWEAELGETQVACRNQKTIALSPGGVSHFLEDFID